MSNQVEIMTNNATNSSADDEQPWMLANLFSTNQQDFMMSQQLLPGPFVVLQGSPGDGMSNTLDSMPMLPIESMEDNNAIEMDESYNYLDSNKRRSSSAAIMNSSLHPLEEMAEEEDEPQQQQQHDNDEDVVVAHNETIGITTRPHTPLLENDATTTTSIIGRERSDSLTTGGGLHYPLGEKSPIMQRRVRSLSFNSTLMQPSTTTTSSTLSLQHHWQQNQNGEGGFSLPLVLDNGYPDDSDNHDDDDDDVYTPVLKRRQQQQGNSSNNSSTFSNPPSATTTTSAAAVAIRRPHNHNSIINNNKKSSTAEEIQSIHKWQQEVSQQELIHLEERNQNVKLLLDRRMRIQEERMLRRSSHHRLSNNADNVDADAHHDDEDSDEDHHGHHHRSGSPVALATATSASSNSSSYEEGSHDDDVSGSAIISTSRSTSPAVSTPPATTTTTPRTITVTPPIIEQREESTNPINQYMNLLELEMSHRSWYQKDGRLVVFQSLPYKKSLSSGEEVVVHPLVFEEEEEEEEGRKQQDREEEEDDDNIVTLAPGTTVMAEEAITLDSRSLKLLHSTACNYNDDDEQRKKQQHHPHRHERSTTNNNNSTTLIFLHISSPYPGYVLSHMHNYPYLAPGLPTTYTNSTWLWRVTCQPDGAFIRSGLDLVTDHIGTLPYGTLCCVKKKVVNYMGLNRLEIEAFVNNDDDDDGGNNDHCGSNDDDDDDADGDKGISAAIPINKLSGYISEFLNPLSGQRGNIVEQVSFPVPALYKVIHAEGVIIRSGVELSTGKIGFAPMGSILSIVGRSYSSNPSNNCIERLRLAGGGGWISVQLNREENEHLVEMIGADESFDPEDPANFHFGQQKKVMAELKAGDNGGSSSSPNSSGGGGGGGGGGSNNYLPRRRSTANLSEIADDDQMSIPDSEGNNYAMSMNDAKGSILSTPPRQSSTAVAAAAAVPTLFQRSGVVGALGGLVAMDAVRESSSDNHQNENANRCLICLSDERTATIVHGETGHIACCLTCARILKARGDNCPVCRLPIDLVIQQFWA